MIASDGGGYNLLKEMEKESKILLDNDIHNIENKESKIIEFEKIGMGGQNFCTMSHIRVCKIIHFL